MEKVEIFQPMKDETEIKNYMTKKKNKKLYNSSLAKMVIELKPDDCIQKIKEKMF